MARICTSLATANPSEDGRMISSLISNIPFQSRSCMEAKQLSPERALGTFVSGIHVPKICTKFFRMEVRMRAYSLGH